MAQYHLGVVMDPIAQIKPYKDTTVAMLLAAQARGWTLDVFTPQDLWVRDGIAWGHAQRITVADEAKDWIQLDGERSAKRLGSYDALLMRKDPPYDMDYIAATWALDLAEQQGSRVFNRPQSLRDCNEKFFITHFPELTTPTLITASAGRVRAFHAEHRDVILKPLDGMGGSGIFRVRDDGLNLGAIIETLSLHGRQQIMAQRYIPEIVDGDTRVLVVHGEPIPYGLARIPQGGETRGNLAAGGRGEARPLSPDQWRIAKALGPTLLARGLHFVGLDVIGPYLTEINVTSPTCAREIDKAFGTDIAGQFMDGIAALLPPR